MPRMHVAVVRHDTTPPANRTDGIAYLLGGMHRVCQRWCFVAFGFTCMSYAGLGRERGCGEDGARVRSSKYDGRQGADGSVCAVPHAGCLRVWHL